MRRVAENLRVLIILPSNLGDVLLCLPAIDLLRAKFKNAKITCVVSFRTKSFIENLSSVDEYVIYLKDWPWYYKWRFVKFLRGKYEAILDFKHTAIPLFIKAKITSPFIRYPSKRISKKDEYLNLTLKTFRIKREKVPISEILIKEERKKYFEKIIKPDSIFISPGANSEMKRYPVRNFRFIIENLLQNNFRIVLIGSPKEVEFSKTLSAGLSAGENLIDLTGKTEFEELAYIFKNYARILLCCDSAPLHLASYLDIPTVAIFGPTDPLKYGPYSSKKAIVRNQKLKCLGCMESQCRSSLECMELLSPQEVLNVFYSLLKDEEP